MSFQEATWYRLCFSKCNVSMNHLGSLLKCRFWCGRSVGGGRESVLLASSQGIADVKWQAKHMAPESDCQGLILIAPLLPLKLWTSYLMSLCFSFFICLMGNLQPLPHRALVMLKLNYCLKALRTVLGP